MRANSCCSYTMSKSTCIIFILVFAVLLRLERLTAALCAVIALISAGLLLFTYRSAQFDLNGFLLVEMAAASAGVRWAMSQYTMQNMGEKCECTLCPSTGRPVEPD